MMGNLHHSTPWERHLWDKAAEQSWQIFKDASRKNIKVFYMYVNKKWKIKESIPPPMSKIDKLEGKY